MFNCITLHEDDDNDDDVQSVTVNGGNCIFVKHLSTRVVCASIIVRLRAHYS